VSPSKDRLNGTSTSDFGSPGRINHDSTNFYNSRLYAEFPKDQKVEYIENPVPDSALDRIWHATSEDMSGIPDSSVHLIVTSPPYNVGKEYDQDFSLPEHLDMLDRVWAQTYRVLVPGGRICVNIANLGRQPYIPMHAFIIRNLLDCGFFMRGEIIWNKSASASASTAWGSWCSASNPTLRDIHEYILVFSKSSNRRPNPANRVSTITRDEFLEYTKSIWTFPAVSAKKIGHPAPFPIELPHRLIQLYTFSGEIVLDPFIGSGQTALAALKNGRRYIGYETNSVYIRLAQDRISDYKNNLDY
jgi:site-specific DNA-methyltransferase (adenine-specific)